MASESDKRALNALMNLIDQADSKLPTDPDAIARRLAVAYGRPDLRASIQSAIRKTVSGRLVNAARLRPPRVVFVVMDNGIAVLGGIGWSGAMQTESTEIDLTARWPDVSKVHYQFPAWLGGLGITSTDRIETSTGPFEITIATSNGSVSRIVPDDNVLDFAGAARKSAVLLENVTQPADADRAPAPVAQNEQYIRGLLRYLPPNRITRPEKSSLLECSAVNAGAAVPGFALIAHDQFWFFDHDDCLVADINDGTPYNFELADIEGCSVLKHESYPLPNYRNVEIQPVSWPDPQLVNLILDVYGEELALSIPAGLERDAAGRQSHQSNFAKFLQLIDEAI